MSVEIREVCNKCAGIPSGACYVYDNPGQDCRRTYFNSDNSEKQSYVDVYIEHQGENPSLIFRLLLRFFDWQGRVVLWV